VKSPSASPQAPHGAAPVPAVPNGRRVSARLKGLLLCLACAAVSAGATVAAFEFFYPAHLPVAMRGKWVVVEGKGLRGATLEFSPEGRMVGTVLGDGKLTTIHGRVQVDGNRFRITTADPRGNVLVTELEEILELSDRQLVVQDSRGEVLIMERPSAGGVR
jgi:hypothetical protein